MSAGPWVLPSWAELSAAPWAELWAMRLLAGPWVLRLLAGSSAGPLAPQSALRLLAVMSAGPWVELSVQQLWARR